MNTESNKAGAKDNLKMQVLFIKRDIKELGMRTYMDEFLSMYPLYNNREGIVKIRNIMNGALANEEIINDLQTWVDSLKAKK